MLAGTWSLQDISRRLDELELWDGDPGNHTGQDHRRWAFESALFDLALRQNELGLGQALGRQELPVRFVVSTRAAPDRWLKVEPQLEFKLDAEPEWDRPLLQHLHGLDRVRVVDLKAYYRGRPVDLAPDPDLYRAIVEELPDRDHRGRVARRRPPRGACGRRGSPELRRARPLARRSRRATASSPTG